MPSRASLKVDRGSGSVLAITVMMLTVALSVAVIIAVAAFTHLYRMQGVADAAALAGADAARGIISADPCLIAADLASAQGVILQHCEQSGEVVTIRFHADVLMFRLAFSAQAGPP